MNVMGLVEDFGLIGLFLNTFLSASILPLPAEPAIIVASGLFNPTTVFILSVIGGVLGSLTIYYIGLKGVHGFLVKRDPEKEKMAQKWFGKYGPIVVVFGPWVPVVGDPLLIVAGALRMDIKLFLTYATIGRIMKNALLIFFSAALFSFI